MNTLEMNNQEAVHSEKSLIIEYNITLFNLPCDHIQVMVYDPLSMQPLPMSIKDKRTSLSHEGIAGETQESHATDQELRSKYLAAEDKLWDWTRYKKLSRSWVRSDATVEQNHQKFDDLVNMNDALMVSFYASWSENCKKFAPIWQDFSKQCDEKKFTDSMNREITTACIKVNCVEFPGLCMEQNIWNYPTVRIYNRGGKFNELQVKKIPSEEILMQELISATSNTRHFKHNHDTNIRGCRLEGHVSTRSVPGEFHFQLGESVLDLEPSMTNTSHEVHSLRFFSEKEKFSPVDLINKVDPTVLENLDPIAGTRFIATRKHQTMMHYLQVVSTFIKVGWNNYHIYQYTSQNSPKIEKKLTVPSAKFQYSISPMNVVYKTTGTTLYQFLTTMCGIIGGAIAIAKVCFSGTNHALTKMQKKQSVGKLG